MTFRDGLAIQLQDSGRKPRSDYEGNDWWQLSAEEAFVFDIKPDRWPRMMTVWCAYEVLLGTVFPEAYGYEEGAVLTEQAAQTALIDRGRCIAGFQAFAKDFAALTFREAAATYDKMMYWNVRNGITEYDDEEGRE